MKTTPIRTLFCLLALSLTLLVGCSTRTSESSVATPSAQTQLPAPVAARTDEPAAPKSIEVGGDSAVTDAVATDTTGALLPPQDVHRLGWWVDSALPGSGKGTIVVTGHVDEASQGRGFAARFSSLAPGTEVAVTTAKGETVHYRVRNVQKADKEKGFPAEELNRLDGPETLALVTCGGAFVGPPLGDADNIIAWATRA